MKRWLTGLIVLALAGAGACSRPSEEQCRKAVENIRTLTGTDQEGTGPDPHAAVRSLPAAAVGILRRRRDPAGKPAPAHRPLPALGLAAVAVRSKTALNAAGSRFAVRGFGRSGGTQRHSGQLLAAGCL